MGMSNRFTDMYEVYAHAETTCKEQPAIRLRHMGCGPNDCRRQPRPQFAVAEGKTKAETRQYKEDQFRALEDRSEASPTQISNLYRHNGNGSRNPSAERRTHGCQHHAQAHATWWVDGFRLDTPEFQSCLQPKEFMVAEKNKKIPQKEVPRKMTKMVPKEGAKIKHQSVSSYVGGTCRQFRRTCLLGGKVAKLVIDPISSVNIISEEAVRKLGLETKRHPNPYQLEWLMKGDEVRVSKYCKVPFSMGTKYIDQVWCDVVDMTMCHLLLGKPWQDDKAAIYDETKNTYSFMLGKTKLTLLQSPWPESKPSQGDGQPVVAKQELTSKEGDINGVVPGSKLPTHPLHTKSLKKHEELEKEVEEVSLSESIALFHEEEPLEEVNLSDSLAILYGNPIHYVIDKTPEDKGRDFSVDSDTLAISCDNYVHYVVDKSSEDKIHNFNFEIIDYVDFLGIDNILFNFHNNDGFGVVGNNYMFKREVPADPFLGIFMACGKEKEREKYGKSKVLPSGVWGHQNNRQSTPLMKSIMILMGCGLVVKLRRGEWNGLIGHPKDRGKDRPNSRTNSLQHGENDADQTEFGASLLLRSSAHRVPYVNFMFLVVKPPLFPCFSSIRVLRVFISLLY
jgi:hypothetical protein